MCGPGGGAIVAEIDESAPVKAAGEVEIAADAETVWQLMSGIDEWPRWNSDIRQAHLEGRLQPGSTFEWRSGPGTITSTLDAVEPGKKLAWHGSTMGVHAKHVWRLQPRDHQRTVVHTEESWTGLPARLFRRSSQHTLEHAIESGLQRLKAAAEETAVYRE